MNRRNTIQKKLVLDAVRELGCHATAGEIYSHIAQQHSSISRGTVYRNLSILSDERDIKRIEIPGEANHFDHMTQKHFHVICVRCKKVFDVDMDPVPELTDHIHDKRGFEFLDCDVVFKGICPACLEKNEDKSDKIEQGG